MIISSIVEHLSHGQTLYHSYNRNADGTPQRWRVNGKVKTWRTRREDFKVPIKYGLKTYDYLTQRNAGLFCLTAEDALKHKENQDTLRNAMALSKRQAEVRAASEEERRMATRPMWEQMLHKWRVNRAKTKPVWTCSQQDFSTAKKGRR